MTHLSGSQLWFAQAPLTPGAGHSFFYNIDGKRFGGSNNVPSPEGTPFCQAVWMVAKPYTQGGQNLRRWAAWNMKYFPISMRVFFAKK